jgi:hypothetical protein
MANKQFVEKLQAALERDAQRPTKDRWDELVARGAIDAEGNVLIRVPGSSKTKKFKKRKR